MAQHSASSDAAWRFEVFYDGDCPLCMKEIRMLQRLDRRQNIRFTDIMAQDFDAAEVGVSFPSLVRFIHGRLPSGELVQGVEVFRQLYAAVGFGPLVALTRLPGVKQLLDFGYEKFAANRLRLTGRCEADVCGLPSQTVNAGAEQVAA